MRQLGEGALFAQVLLDIGERFIGELVGRNVGKRARSEHGVLSRALVIGERLQVSEIDEGADHSFRAEGFNGLGKEDPLIVRDTDRRILM